MRVIRGVLREELDNSLRMQKGYQRQIRKLPKGSLVKKTIRGRAYYYLAVREGGRVRFTYQGKLTQAQIDRHKKIVRNRARYRKLLSEVNSQIRFLRRALRGKKPG